VAKVARISYTQLLHLLILSTNMESISTKIKQRGTCKMKTNKLNRSKGFTIIETLIVLAIAATIFLVVFLAVTALNRSSRNTQRKDDAAAMIAGFSEYASNNSGQLPNNASWSAPNLTLCNVSNCTKGTDAEAIVKIGYYSAVSTGTYSPTAGTINILTSVPTGAVTDTLNIITGAICNGNTATTTGAGARSVAAQYAIEASGGLTWTCSSS